MDGRRRNRRDYDFQYKQNRAQSRRNVDTYFARNFGFIPVPLKLNASRSRRQNNLPLQNIPRLRNPQPRPNLRSGDNRQGLRLGGRRPEQQQNNRPQGVPQQRNRGRGRGRGRGGRNPNPINNNGNNNQRRRNNKSKNILQNNKPKQNTLNRRAKRRNIGPIGKLDIGNLGPDVVNTDLLQIFSIYGRLKRCAVIFQDGASTGKGVVQFESRVCAQRAENDLNGTLLKSTNITVQLSKRKKKEETENASAVAKDVNM
jgi:hypothetical protein